ncbi:MAG: Hint domain-containing protein, partial [Phycisphaerales bacterium]
MPTPTQYYLYLPVWATGQAPTGGGSSELSSSTPPSTEWSGSINSSTAPASSANSTLVSSSTPPGSSAQSTLESSFESTNTNTGGGGSSSADSSNQSTGGGSSGGGSSGGGSSGGGSSGGGSSGGGSSGGGSSGGGSSGGGSSGGGSSGGGSSDGGSSGGGSNCFLFGTLVTIPDGRRVPIETLTPGDLLMSLSIPGLEPDADWQAQYDWRSSAGLDDVQPTPAPVGQITLGTHPGFYIINRRLKLTFEHPMLIRRENEWGFCSAELLQIGDRLIDANLNEEPITTIEHIASQTHTVSIHIPGTNTYLAEGVWTHNDLAKAPINSIGGLSGAGS